MNVGRKVVITIVVLLAAQHLGRSVRGEEAPDESPPTEVGRPARINTPVADEGSVAYATYCVGCHGEKGDGDGPAARFLSPRPRDFRKAKFKFSSTRTGRLPTDEDLRRTITRGLKGSAMPGWELMPVRTVNALMAYIKTFSPRWQERHSATPIPLVEDPYRSVEDKSMAIARGQVVYHGYSTCWTCHPAYVPTTKINEYLLAMKNPARDAFRKGLEQAEATPNEEGEVIFPPDFRRDFVRSARDVDDLYRSIAAGITGTAMPTWVDSMEAHVSGDSDVALTRTTDLWAMAYYVESLIAERPTHLEPETVQVRERSQRIYAEGEAFQPVRPLESHTTGEDYEGD